MTNPTDSVEYMLGRMDAKLDQLLGLEARVRVLEVWKSRTAGYIAGASAVSGVLVGIVLHFIK